MQIVANRAIVIAETTDRKAVVLAVVAPVHVGVGVGQVAAIRAVRIALILRRGPEVGGVACAEERRTVAAARWNSGKSRGVVRGRIVAHRTCVTVAIPSLRGSQRLGDVVCRAVALVLALAAHVVGHSRPLRIARQVPTHRTDAPAVAIKYHSHRIAEIGIHARLPVCRVEGIHRRVPVVQQSVVHRRVGGGVVVVPESLLARVGVSSAGGRDEVSPRCGRGGGAQVLLGPALVANLHGVIDVAFVVRNRGGAASKWHLLLQVLHGLLQGVKLAVQVGEAVGGEVASIVVKGTHIRGLVQDLLHTGGGVPVGIHLGRHIRSCNVTSIVCEGTHVGRDIRDGRDVLCGDVTGIVVKGTHIGRFVENLAYAGGGIPVGGHLGHFTAISRDGISVRARTIHNRDKDVGACGGGRYGRRDAVRTVGHIISVGAAIRIGNGVGIDQASGAGLHDRLDAITRGARGTCRASRALRASGALRARLAWQTLVAL